MLSLIFSMSYANAYDVAQGSDWKWSYARTYVNDDDDDLSKLAINAADIEYARIMLNASIEDCDSMGGQWCEWSEADKKAFDRMLKAQTTETKTSTSFFFKMWDTIAGIMNSVAKVVGINLGI